MAVVVMMVFPAVTVVVIMAFLAVTVVMMMPMLPPFSRLALFFSVHGHCHVRSCDPASRSPHCLQPDARQSQTVHHIEKSLFIIKQLIKSRHKHIACGPHIAFNIYCFHTVSPPL